MAWVYHFSKVAEKRLRRYRKKWDHEVGNVLDNLDTLRDSLSLGTRPEQLKKLGFVRSEPAGILAISEKGPGKGGRMKAVRLYVYPDEQRERLD